MGAAQLIQRQWEGYSRVHRSRSNLLIHIVAVPLFLTGNIGLVASVLHGSITAGAFWLACMVLSIALQGRGHKQEAIPPEPFTSPGNAIARIFIEQWVTFPRFLLSGGWSDALSAYR